MKTDTWQKNVSLLFLDGGSVAIVIEHDKLKMKKKCGKQSQIHKFIAEKA